MRLRNKIPNESQIRYTNLFILKFIDFLFIKYRTKQIPNGSKKRSDPFGRRIKVKIERKRNMSACR